MVKLLDPNGKYKVGARFGTLQIVGAIFYRPCNGKRKRTRPCCTVLCSCGNQYEIVCDSLNVVVSCSRCGHKRHTVHNKDGVKLWNVWHAMKHRCSASTNPSFKNYGGRGITVCEAWSSYAAFRDWSLASGYRVGLTLDRIDNNGNYEPSNCRWVTMKTQSNNTRRNRLLCIFGETKTVTQWSEDARCNVPLYVLRSRVKAGWSLEEAITKEAPVRKKH